MNLFCVFLNSEEIKIKKLFKLQLNKINKKINRLVSDCITEKNSKILRIVYSCSTSNSIGPCNLKPMSLFYRSPSFIHDKHEKWFINLTGTHIPIEVQLLLQLGERFNLPITNRKNITFEFIKCLENNLKKLNKANRISSRNRAVSIINKFNNYYTPDETDKVLIEWVSITKKFINNNKDIMFTKRIRAILRLINNIDYKQKMLLLLSDIDTYEKTKKDSCNQITENLRSLLRHWKIKGFIDEHTYRRLLVTDGLLLEHMVCQKFTKQVTHLE